MNRVVTIIVLCSLFLFARPAEAATYGLGLRNPPPSYVQGYGRLSYEDSSVAVYDNTGGYTPEIAKYRRRSRSTSTTCKNNTSSWEKYKGRRHCAFQPDKHIPKCYVYDDCTYDELYGDSYPETCEYSNRKDVRYNSRTQYKRAPLKEGSRHRSRPYPLYSRDNYEFQNSFNHYDSYWGTDGNIPVNTYEWYDY